MSSIHKIKDKQSEDMDSENGDTPLDYSKTSRTMKAFPNDS